MPKKPPEVRILIADDHPIFRDGLRRLLQAEGLHVVGEAPNGEEAVKLARQLNPAIVAGYSNRDIAQKFSISEQTVKHHLTNTFDKLGVSTRLELALFAVNHGLTE